MNNKKGFTLIETLIAVLLFSIIIGLATYSFSFYTNLIKKIVKPYPEEAVNFSKLRSAIDSLFYYVTEKKDPFGTVNFSDFFSGKKTQIQFISAHPIENTTLSICKIFYDNKTIFYEESPIYEKNNDYNNPQITPNSKKIAILKNIDDFSIKYFIGSSLYNTLKGRYPTLIEVSFKKEGKAYEYFFKIKSNFYKKKTLTHYLYEPF